MSKPRPKCWTCGKPIVADAPAGIVPVILPGSNPAIPRVACCSMECANAALNAEPTAPAPIAG